MPYSFRPTLAKRAGPDYASCAMFRDLPEMVAIGVRKLARIFAECGEAAARGRLPEVATASHVRALPASAKSLGLGLAIILIGTNVSGSGVLSESDVKKVEDLKPLFQNLMGDLVQTSRRSDLSSGDAECVKSTVRELLEISQELSSYEYLITIEKDMTDVGDNESIRGVVKFAVDKSNTILSDERKRLAQLSEQCTRFPLSFGKTQQALQFIDTTSGILKAIQARL
jgi:hypothetical protein